MEKGYTEQEVRAVLGGPVTESEIVSRKIKEAYGNVRESVDPDRRAAGKRNFKKLCIAASVAAAVFVGAVCFCAANPALAAKLPLIGNIFRQQEENVSYPGDYSGHTTQLVTEEQQEAGTADPRYSQTSGGVTVTISECCADSMAMYLGVSIDAKDGFPREMIACAKDTGSAYSVLQMESDAVMKLSEDKTLVFDPSLGTRAADVVEGNFVNDSRFEGIIRIQLDGRKGTDESGNIVELSGLTESFQYELHVSSIYVSQASLHDIISLEGNWDFSLDVTPDDSRVAVKNVGLVNEEGVGIGTVRKSDYEISAQLLLPEGASAGDYMMIMTDADGKQLPRRDDAEDVCSVYQRNAGKVTITVWNQAVYEAHRGDEAYLKENAAFTTEVDFTE